MALAASALLTDSASRRVGTFYGGHYIAFIRPNLRDWLQFDDEIVKRVTRERALDSNFGGEIGGVRSYSSAYMLVYVRDSAAHLVMQDIPVEDIPQQLLSRFEQEEELNRRRDEERANAALYMDVHVRWIFGENSLSFALVALIFYNFFSLSAVLSVCSFLSPSYLFLLLFLFIIITYGSGTGESRCSCHQLSLAG